MINYVKSFLKTHNLLSSSKTFLIGFSGGYDSMCLLDILRKLSQENGFKIVALHINHNWRGVESKNEQENCENYCETHGIKIYTDVLDENIPKTETFAREKRQELFKQYYKKFNADGLFLAHTKSDNTETILYRIAKGTGINGLCGILKHSKLDECEIYRPLMHFSREDILNYCKANNLCPNNDSSNSDTKYARNFIRHKIIPEFRNINSNIDDAIRSLSQIAISEQNIIKEYLGEIRKKITKNNYIITEAFTKLSKDVQNKLILDFLIARKLDYDSKKVEEIYDFINKNVKSKSGKTLSLTSNFWLFVSEEKIQIINSCVAEKSSQEIKIDKCGEYRFKNLIFKIEEYCDEKNVNFPTSIEPKAFVKLDKNFSFTLRTRKDGDIIQPFGMNGKMKLKKYFINKGVEKFKRDDIILLCKDDEILWAAETGLSEKLRSQEIPTHILSIENG